jgi:hypothetical protein
MCDASNRRAATRLTLFVTLLGDRSCMLRLDEDDVRLFSINEASVESSSAPARDLKRRDKGLDERLRLLVMVV